MRRIRRDTPTHSAAGRPHRARWQGSTGRSRLAIPRACRGLSSSRSRAPVRARAITDARDAAPGKGEAATERHLGLSSTRDLFWAPRAREATVLQVRALLEWLD